MKHDEVEWRRDPRRELSEREKKKLKKEGRGIPNGDNEGASTGALTVEDVPNPGPTGLGRVFDVQHRPTGAVGAPGDSSGGQGKATVVTAQTQTALAASLSSTERLTGHEAEI